MIPRPTPLLARFGAAAALLLPACAWRSPVAATHARRAAGPVPATVDAGSAAASASAAPSLAAVPAPQSRGELRADPAGAPVALPRGTVPPHAIASGPPDAPTRAWLAANCDARTVVLGTAPLAAAGGSITVAITGGGSAEIVIRDGGAVQLAELPSEFGWSATAARFADLDGDGRTDVVVASALFDWNLEESPDDENGSPANARPAGPTQYQAVLAPPPASPAGDAPQMERDDAAGLAMRGARDIDAAVLAALAVPVRGPTAAEACRVATAARTLAGARAVAAPGAQFLTYPEPFIPTLQASAQPLARVAPRTYDPPGPYRRHFRCADLQCPPGRPFCSWENPHDGPYAEQFWFTWADGRVRLLAIAQYGGD